MTLSVFLRRAVTSAKGRVLAASSLSASLMVLASTKRDANGGVGGTTNVGIPPLPAIDSVVWGLEKDKRLTDDSERERATDVGPRARREPRRIEACGDIREDLYYWIRDDDRKNEEVLVLCKEENDHAAKAMSGTEALQEELYAEMRGRILEQDISVPVREGPYLYYHRTEDDKQYPIHCRRRLLHSTVPYSAHQEPPTYPEEVLLDENDEAEKSPSGFYMLAQLEQSPSHSLLAVCEDRVGNELYTLRFLRTGDAKARAQLKHDEAAAPESDQYQAPTKPPQHVGKEIPNTSGSIAWATDDVIYYVTKDPKLDRPCKVWRHRLNSPDSDDELVFHEDDEAFNVGLERSRSGDVIYISAHSAITSDVRYIKVEDPDSELRPLLGRKEGVEYSAADRNGKFYILTNDNALNSKLIELDPTTAKVEEILGHQDSVRLEDVTLFKKHMVISERSRGLQRLVIRQFESSKSSELLPSAVPVPVKEEAYSIWAKFAEFNSPILRYGYTSMTTPSSVFDIDMNSPTTPVLKKQQPVLGGFDPTHYVTKRVWASAPDGEQVPISILYRKEFQDAPRPTHLYGYGSYEISIDPYFSSSRLSLVDRGVTYAIAHVRGGGEMGRRWYEDGKFLKKENTWKDFIACAQHLVSAGFTDQDRITIEGRSAGGLLIGATLNTAPKRPDGRPFFAGAVAGVPFVDVLTTMLDPTIPLTVVEYDEWGNPQDPKYYNYMKSYSPVDNVSPENGPYPPVLIKGGLHDPRVGYWEPMKYAQVLRDAGAKTVICKIDTSAGHFSQSGRFDRLKELAFDYAFVLRALGMEKVPPVTPIAKSSKKMSE